MIAPETIATIVILALAFVGFATGRVPPALVALGVAVALWATGVVTIPEAFAGFGNPTIIFIAALFVVSEGLDATGITARAGRFVVERAGNKSTRALVLLMVIQACLTAFMSVSGTVATMLPVAVIIANRLSIPPSRLLLPMVYATHAGSLLLLTGTPVNVIVSELAAAETGRSFGFFGFAVAGLPLVVGTIVLTVLLRRALLPDRPSMAASRDLRALTDSLVRSLHGDDAIVRVRVRSGSPILGDKGADRIARFADGIRVLAVRDATGRPKPRGSALVIGDIATVRAPRELIERLVIELNLEETRHRGGGSAFVDGQAGVAEFVVSPRSSLVGAEAFPGMSAGDRDLVVIAIHRDGHEVDARSLTLDVGDVLLLHGSWEALDAAGENRDLLLVEDPSAIRRQVAPIGRRGWTAVGVVGAMVVLLATGLVPAPIAALLAAGAMVLLRIVRIDRAYRAISWTTVILVAGLIPLSTAFEHTGLDTFIGDFIVGIVGPAGPLGALTALCVIVIVLGQVMSNTATVLIIAPVALSVAAALDVSVLPFLMALTVSAAGAVLTPIATAANLMVFETGGYRFGDYARYGMPIALLYLGVAVLIVPLFWPF